MTGHRFMEQRRSAPTIESHSLPIVGAAQRHRRRAACWRRIAFYLLVFWAGIALALVIYG